MQVSATLKNLRVTPRKVRLVSRAIKGLDATAARHQLAHIIKRSSHPLSKLLDSALANAHNNNNLVKENLFIKDIVVNEGPKLKRFRPKGFGMASPIEKKTSHIKIVLEEKVPGLKAAEVKSKKEEVKSEEAAPEATETKQEKTVKIETGKKPAPTPSGRGSDQSIGKIKKELGKKGGIFGQAGKIKKFFRRKAI